MVAAPARRTEHVEVMHASQEIGYQTGEKPLARLLHCSCVTRRRPLYRWPVRAAGLATTTLVLAGCFMSPPIHPMEPEMNHPPYIDPDFVRPRRELVRVESIPVRLSVEAILDPNEEDVLYYAWIGKNSGLIEQAQVWPNLEQSSLYKGIFYQFGRVELEIDPCSERLRGVDTETIWIYVADRRFTRVSGEGVEVDTGGYVESHSWVLEFRTGLCRTS